MSRAGAAVPWGVARSERTHPMSAAAAHQPPPSAPIPGLPPHSHGGRSPYLTQEVRQKILGAIASGANRWVAAQVAGVGRSTLGDWLTRGRKKTDPFYVEFLEQVKKAEAEAEVAAVVRINRASVGGTVIEKKTVTVTKADGTTTTTTVEKNAPGQWQAAAWLLERKYPGRYGSQRTEIRMLEAHLADTLARLSAITGAQLTPAAAPAQIVEAQKTDEAPKPGGAPLGAPAGLFDWSAGPAIPQGPPGGGNGGSVGNPEHDW